MPHDRIDPRKTAPGAQDAQRAEESKHHDSARSLDVGLPAAGWAILDAQQAIKRATRHIVGGDPCSAVGELNNASKHIGAARDSIQGLMP